MFPEVIILPAEFRPATLITLSVVAPLEVMVCNVSSVKPASILPSLLESIDLRLSSLIAICCKM